MEGAHFLFVNDYEFELISKKTGWDMAQILQHVKVVVVTRGKDGADLYTRGEQVFIPTVPERQIVDPTGVGDAFRGGFLAGYAHGLDWKLCGRLARWLRSIAWSKKGPQNHVYTCAEFVKRFREHFDDGGKLNELVGD